MAKHLTDLDISNICELLDGWDTDYKLTWDKLVGAIKHELNITTTRQTLNKYTRITKAFVEVKSIVNRVSSGKKSNVQTAKTPASLKIAQETIDRQNNTIQRLERENNELLEQFHVWLYNASTRSITPDMLNTPLPTPATKSHAKGKGK